MTYCGLASIYEYGIRNTIWIKFHKSLFGPKASRNKELLQHQCYILQIILMVLRMLKEIKIWWWHDD